MAFPSSFTTTRETGTFLRQAGGALAQNPSNAEGFGWADFENDGDPDLFVGSEPGPGHFYRNDGQGKFVSLTPAQVGSIAVRSGSEPETAAWADYDGDGYLDLFVGDTTGSQNLHHNEGTGKFARAPAATAGSIATDLVFGRSASWFDADGDGDLDLFVVSDNPNVDCAFYRNEGAGRFTRLMAAEVGPLVTIRAELTQSTVADYDNDGDLDLVLLAYGTNTINQLYQNNGHGVFALATAGALGTEGAYSAGASWGDYDNDGWLDLCIANLGVFGSGKGQNNFLYHNNGDGTFSRIMTGSIANEIGSSFTPVWVDYDNDGAMDLFISNGAGGPQERNFLYRNNGNANHWLKFRLRGTLSNRSAIGAKVRVKATVWGKSFWQMRQITVGDGLLSAQEPRPHFGLGDATSAETVRIEWPSGIVQEFVNVRADQSLVLTEPSQLLPSVRRDGGSVDLMVRAWAGQSFVVESSAQLGAWQLVATVTNLTGTLRFADPSTSQPQQFYRLRSISP
ncbi:MAG: CRTAC1 family protein [Verrucomicrobiota bacterium]